MLGQLALRQAEGAQWEDITLPAALVLVEVMIGIDGRGDGDTLDEEF